MQSPFEIVLMFVILILSVILHEVAHGYAANALGDPTARLSDRLTLNPIPHIDPIGSILIPALLILSGTGILFGWAKPVPYNPYNLKNQRWGEAIVAVAGSATNLLLALIFAGLARAAFAGFIPATAGVFAEAVCLVNLSLGLFNLIPFPPMDGYTFLRGLLPYRFSHAFMQFEGRIRATGSLGIIVVLFAFSFFLAPLFFSLVSVVFSTLVGHPFA